MRGSFFLSFLSRDHDPPIVLLVLLLFNGLDRCGFLLLGSFDDSDWFDGLCLNLMMLLLNRFAWLLIFLFNRFHVFFLHWFFFFFYSFFFIFVLCFRLGFHFIVFFGLRFRNHLALFWLLNFLGLFFMFRLCQRFMLFHFLVLLDILDIFVLLDILVLFDILDIFVFFGNHLMFFMILYILNFLMFFHFMMFFLFLTLFSLFLFFWFGTNTCFCFVFRFSVVMFGCVSELRGSMPDSSPVFDALFLLPAHFDEETAGEYLFIELLLNEVDRIDFCFKDNFKGSGVVLFDFDKVKPWEGLLDVLLDSAEVALDQVQRHVLNIIVQILDAFDQFLLLGDHKLTLLLFTSLHQQSNQFKQQQPTLHPSLPSSPIFFSLRPRPPLSTHSARHNFININYEHSLRSLSGYFRFRYERSPSDVPSYSQPQLPGPSQDMTLREAQLILGVIDKTDHAGIKAKHRQIMMNNHPDNNGSTYLATKINEAKDMLLNG